MRVTHVEIVRCREPISLPQPWRPAWRGPLSEPITSFSFALYRVYTDEGIVGIGPYTGASPDLVKGMNPFLVGEFWELHMSGRRTDMSGKRAAGLEIALWDIIGKAAQQPIYRLLGARRDRIMVYAATSRLLTKEEHIRQVKELAETGFKAIKLRLHRQDPKEDLRVVEAVKEVVGDGVMILVDANQNHFAEGYSLWSRSTALRMAKRLDELGVYFLEEPLPRTDVEGLAEIAASVDMFIAGGEHTPIVYDFRGHLLSGAYDILQPDVILTGNMGIIGLRKVAEMADCFGRLVIPHVCSDGVFSLSLAATLHAMATVENCPMVEYPYDPPILTPKTMQAFVKEPLWIDREGFVALPDRPGLGVELDEERLVVISER